MAHTYVIYEVQEVAADLCAFIFQFLGCHYFFLTHRAFSLFQFVALDEDLDMLAGNLRFEGLFRLVDGEYRGSEIL
jgi:hypothetical protein